MIRTNNEINSNTRNLLESLLIDMIEKAKYKHGIIVREISVMVEDDGSYCFGDISIEVKDE